MKNTLIENLGKPATERDLFSMLAKMHELKREVASLVDQRVGIQAKITDRNNLARGRDGKKITLNSRQYQQYCEDRAKYVDQIRDIERKRKEVKIQIQELSDFIYLHRTESKKIIAAHRARVEEVKPVSVKKECIQALVALREKYQQFYEDKTRVRSMRDMAREFANLLTPIIKDAING